ncbi:MAG: hypothetical protein GY847_36070, partial [Proteobacteria bacterium]|nr:hypothetical protein [Pseudomonadota bacterium]
MFEIESDEDVEAMQARLDREGGLQPVEPIRADWGMDPDAIRKMKPITKKKKGQKSLIPDSMKSTGPMPRDQSETSEQLMHRVIKVVARVPIGQKNDYDQYVIFTSNEATMVGVWLGHEALKNETDFEYFRCQFQEDYTLMRKMKTSCQCLIARAQVRWEVEDQRGPEDADQILRALIDIPPKYCYYGLTLPAYARITHLPKKLQLYWYEAYHGIAAELRRWRQAQGPLFDLAP